MHRMTLTLAAGLALALAVPLEASAGPVAPCTLAPASTLAQARIQVTCVAGSKRARKLADAIGRRTRTVVHSDACEQRREGLAVCDFVVTAGRRRWDGSVSVRGTSRRPALLRVRLLGFG